ncbi:uncharacterized protein LOC116168056 [Photinus pyralis]|uniref:uncharacterized protein LOC116168056 n=1 Tax=Photinus pyralis TaxID=7054 RepID=UPI0012670952|nr:uncharacterized protein LOC116168056 [Photinus pyralis]
MPPPPPQSTKLKPTASWYSLSSLTSASSSSLFNNVNSDTEEEEEEGNEAAPAAAGCKKYDKEREIDYIRRVQEFIMNIEYDKLILQPELELSDLPHYSSYCHINKDPLKIDLLEFDNYLLCSGLY